VVYGRVQGVGFRWFVQHAGQRLGLVGNVSNRPDGTVEITVEGKGSEIEQFIQDVSRGPSMAYVEHVEVHEINPTGRYRSFQIEGW